MSTSNIDCKRRETAFTTRVDIDLLILPLLLPLLLVAPVYSVAVMLHIAGDEWEKRREGGGGSGGGIF